MFHVKCIDCRHFDKNDGCKFDLDDENCNRYERTINDEDCVLTNCDDCVWNCNGFCDFEESPSENCRKFKSKKEDF
ncbi:MAG: hypothetical protein IJW64_00055 [Clostridia bacterium]|nr:hypothetical protein [Clostridia bacterium]